MNHREQDAVEATFQESASKAEDKNSKSSTTFELPLDPVDRSESNGSHRSKALSKVSGRKATGPRTAHGKERSKLNALKHGLFSKTVLLKGESRAAYLSLLNGLRDDWQPQGTLESIEVENLAVLFWRKARFFQAESAEISEKVEFMESEFIANQCVEAWDHSRAAIASGGLLKKVNNRFVFREAIQMLVTMREQISTDGLREDSRFFKKLYGQDQDEGTPFGLRLIYELYATYAKLAVQRGDKSEEARLKEIMVVFIDGETERLKRLEKALEAADRERLEYKSSAAIIPGPDASDRLLRYEAHLTREIERVLNRLERLQRMRLGQPVAPKLEIEINE